MTEEEMVAWHHELDGYEFELLCALPVHPMPSPRPWQFCLFRDVIALALPSAWFTFLVMA